MFTCTMWGHKHVRKRAYVLIPHPESYKQIMALRNRKQIPFCELHHVPTVHGGKYNGMKIVNLAPRQTLIDGTWDMGHGT